MNHTGVPIKNQMALSKAVSATRAQARGNLLLFSAFSMSAKNFTKWKPARIRGIEIKMQTIPNPRLTLAFRMLMALRTV